MVKMDDYQEAERRAQMEQQIENDEKYARELQELEKTDIRTSKPNVLTEPNGKSYQEAVEEFHLLLPPISSLQSHNSPDISNNIEKPGETEKSLETKECETSSSVNKPSDVCSIIAKCGEIENSPKQEIKHIKDLKQSSPSEASPPQVPGEIIEALRDDFSHQEVFDGEDMPEKPKGFSGFSINPNGSFPLRFEGEYSPPSSHRKLIQTEIDPIDKEKQADLGEKNSVEQVVEEDQKFSKAEYQEVLSKLEQKEAELAKIKADMEKNENILKKNEEVLVKLEEKDEELLKLRKEVAEKDKMIAELQEQLRLRNEVALERNERERVGDCNRNAENKRSDELFAERCSKLPDVQEFLEVLKNVSNILVER